MNIDKSYHQVEEITIIKYATNSFNCFMYLQAGIKGRWLLNK